MLKPSWVGILGMLIAGQVLATPKKFSCASVGGTDEWTIYVDLAKKKAGFFDNDTTAIIRLKEVRSLESYPPQMLYIFEGKDARPGARLRIDFNETRRSASVTLNYGRPNAETLKSKDGCKIDEDVDL